MNRKPGLPPSHPRETETIVARRMDSRVRRTMIVEIPHGMIMQNLRVVSGEGEGIVRLYQKHFSKTLFIERKVDRLG